jgi:glycerophosphoryl diester phosphodiesterase
MNPLLDLEARLVIAHRGNSAFYPEDTLEAFHDGVAAGADGLEFDVHLSRDGHAVVIHDPTLERTTNGTGRVDARTLAELRQLDAGYCFTRDGGRTFPFRGHGITIPSLEQVIDAFPGVPMIVEIKTAAASAETRRVITNMGVTGRVLVGAFDDPANAPFRGSPVAHSASRREIAWLYLRALLPGTPKKLGYQALAIPPMFSILPLPVLRFARMARAAGAATHVWTIDDPARAQRYWNGGVVGIITNDPRALLASDGRGSPDSCATASNHTFLLAPVA